MKPNVPRVSVIIPTHNRCILLRQTLESLSHQTYSLDEVEILVVADGCSDNTVNMLTHYQAPFLLQVIQQPGQGPAAARNTGAAHAAGQLLLFLDDDIEATPSLIQAHVWAHHKQPGGVVIGYLRPMLRHQTGFFRFALQSWWERMFEIMREPGHRFAYTDLLSGNFSLSAELFHKVGGFDAGFTCHEDYELGVRLHKAGAPFIFVSEAMGYHQEATDLDRALYRKYQEGQADVQLGRRYPELRPTLMMTQLYRYSLLPSRIMRFFALNWPFAGDLLLWTIQSSLRLWEGLRLRGTWQRIVDGLLGYWYWRGVAQELKSSRAVEDFLEVRSNPSGEDQDFDIELDLSLGIDVAERELNEKRPASAFLRYGTQPIGCIRPQPGAECLKGAHLRWLLANRWSIQLLRAMALAGVLNIPIDVDRLVATCERKLEQQGRYEKIRI
jgi:GT2 family glycosyltransferase